MAGLVVRGARGGCPCRVTGAAGDGTTTGNAAGEDTSGAWLPWTAVPRDAGADGAAAPSWTMSRTMSRFRIVSGCRYPATPAKEMIPPARPRARPTVRTVAQSGPRRRFRLCTAGVRITGSGPVSSCGRYGEFTPYSARSSPHRTTWTGWRRPRGSRSCPLTAVVRVMVRRRRRGRRRGRRGNGGRPDDGRSHIIKEQVTVSRLFCDVPHESTPHRAGLPGADRRRRGHVVGRSVVRGSQLETDHQRVLVPVDRREPDVSDPLSHVADHLGVRQGALLVELRAYHVERAARVHGLGDRCCCGVPRPRCHGDGETATRSEARR